VPLEVDDSRDAKIAPLGNTFSCIPKTQLAAAKTVQKINKLAEEQDKVSQQFKRYAMRKELRPTEFLHHYKIYKNLKAIHKYAFIQRKKKHFPIDQISLAIRNELSKIDEKTLFYLIRTQTTPKVLLQYVSLKNNKLDF